jgi:hypothetical protein
VRREFDKTSDLQIVGATSQATINAAMALTAPHHRFQPIHSDRVSPRGLMKGSVSNKAGTRNSQDVNCRSKATRFPSPLGKSVHHVPEHAFTMSPV